MWAQVKNWPIAGALRSVSKIVIHHTVTFVKFLMKTCVPRVPKCEEIEKRSIVKREYVQWPKSRTHWVGQASTPHHSSDRAPRHLSWFLLHLQSELVWIATLGILRSRNRRRQAEDNRDAEYDDNRSHTHRNFPNESTTGSPQCRDLKPPRILASRRVWSKGQGVLSCCVGLGTLWSQAARSSRYQWRCRSCCELCQWQVSSPRLQPRCRTRPLRGCQEPCIVSTRWFRCELPSSENSPEMCSICLHTAAPHSMKHQQKTICKSHRKHMMINSWGLQHKVPCFSEFFFFS